MWALTTGLPADANTWIGIRDPGQGGDAEGSALPPPTRDPNAIHQFLTKHLG